jgi:hypothetical protein
MRGTVQLPSSRADAAPSGLAAPFIATATSAAPLEASNSPDGQGSSPARSAGSLEAVWEHVEGLRRRMGSGTTNGETTGDTAGL